MEPKISFNCGAFELPLPRGQAGRDGEWNADRRPEQIEIGDRSEDRLFSPHRDNFEDSAGDKQRDRKMDNDWMLGVWREESSSDVEWIRGRCEE